MKANDLFVIILKIFGIYLIKDVFLAIPAVLYEFIQWRLVEADSGLAYFSLFLSVLILSLRLLIVYFLLFRTSYLVSKLKLTQDLSDEPMGLNLHRSTVFIIAIITSGILILVFAIPNLIKHIYYWYNFVDSGAQRMGQTYDFSQMLISIAEVIIGFLFLGNQRTIVNFIEYKGRKRID